MESTIKRQCILNGVRIAYKARPVFRPQMITIAGFFPKEGNAESLSRRAAIVTAYACVGRSAEVDLTHFNDSYWHTYWKTFDLNEFKTNNQNPMNTFPDKSNYEIDFFHSLACYAVTKGGNLLANMYLLCLLKYVHRWSS